MGQMIIRPLDSDVLGAAELKVVSAKILSIDIIDDENQPITSDIVQYVNLKKDEKYVDGKIVKNLYQLGNILRAKVTFDMPGEHHFTLKLIADGNNVRYSEDEKEQFYTKYQENILDFITDRDGTKIIEGENELFLNQSGDSFYSPLAKDDFGGKALIKPNLLAKRLVYFIEVKMKGISIDSSCWDDFFKVYDKLGITFKKLSSIEIDYKANIGTNLEENQLKRDLEEIYASTEEKTKFHPHCVVISCVNQLAVKAFNKKLKFFRIVKNGPDKVIIPIRNSTGGSHQLWQNIVDKEGWFVECYFIEDGSGKKGAISMEKCTPIQTIGMPINYCEAVEVDVSHLSEKSGEIALTVNWVDYFRAGITYLNSNIITIATQGSWMPISAREQACTLIHEFGHKIGMVPESVPNQYTESGHNGPHCHAGLEKRLDYRNVKGSTCVMFGETNRIMNFCEDCSNEVKKVNLLGGVFP